MRNSAYPAWLVCLCLSITIIWTQVGSAAEQDETYELMRLFVDTFEEIDKNYVKDIDRRDLIEAAIQGMLLKLDPYSNYISPDDLAKFNQTMTQEFGGIGIQVHFDPVARELVVMTPLPGTPAHEAGVLAGDRIIKIGETDVADFKIGNEIQTAVKLLKGPAGKKIAVTVRHEAVKVEGTDPVEYKRGDPEVLNIPRAVIKVATAMGDRYNPDGSWNFMLDDEKKIGYIRLSHFSRNSAGELQAAMKELQHVGLKGLILDLRWNPGGLLGAATEISDMFIESGKIVSTKGRNTPERIWRAKKRGTYSGFPMTVLINRYSASASEIVSACLQDHDRAVIIGERSWGKGSVQNVIQLESGNSALKLTTASYHRPSGKNIHRFPKAKKTDQWGVMPDDNHIIRFSTEQMLGYRKYRSQRDVLSDKEPARSSFIDTQLNDAMDYIVTQLENPKSEKEGNKADEKPAAAVEEVGKKAALLNRRFLVVPAGAVL